MRADLQHARRRLIVNADDFGFTPAVTAGILEAHAAGAVTSTSMMVRCPGWNDGVRRARATPTLGVGLHLNLLVGVPLAAVPSLTDARSGRFVPLATMVRRALLGRIDAGEVTAECEAQLAALADAGIPFRSVFVYSTDLERKIARAIWNGPRMAVAELRDRREFNELLFSSYEGISEDRLMLLADEVFGQADVASGEGGL